MSSLPLGDIASITPKVLDHVGVAVNGKVEFVFPRGTPYMKIKKFADKIPDSEIRLVKVRVTCEILEENEIYDTSAKVTY